MLKRYSLGAGQNVARTIVIVAFPCSTETTPKETRGVGVLRGASASVVQGSGSGGLVRRKFARAPPTITAPDPMTRTHRRMTREVFVRPAVAEDISDPQVRRASCAQEFGDRYETVGSRRRVPREGESVIAGGWIWPRGISR